jgi:hypothetical protein
LSAINLVKNLFADPLSLQEQQYQDFWDISEQIEQKDFHVNLFSEDYEKYKTQIHSKIIQNQINMLLSGEKYESNLGLILAEEIYEANVVSGRRVV